jgi:hypothetical protein
MLTPASIAALNQEIEYLYSFLEDEFRSFENVRLRRVLPSSLSRAADLPQDYDPNSQDLHLRTGVMLRLGGREYYFPVQWVRLKDYGSIQNLVREARRG